MSKSLVQFIIEEQRRVTGASGDISGLYQRVPVILGSRNEVERVVSYHKGV